MYAEFFGLRELPFNNTPDARFFYSTPDHEEALASLIYAVQQRKGFVLLTGEVGAGKTLVSRLMLHHFGGGIEFATINHAVESASDLLEAVCTEFQLPVEPGSGNTQLVRQLHDFLLARFAQNVPVVLVLDEAQSLPVPAFEQLRMIGNLESDDAKLLQICILGQPELQDMINAPEVRQLKQRIFRSFHLPALSLESTGGYIRHRLSVAGGEQADLFASDAIELIFEYSRGLPRLINAVCDNAMLSAYSAGKPRIDAATVTSVVTHMMLPDAGTRSPAGHPHSGHYGHAGHGRRRRHQAHAGSPPHAVGPHRERYIDTEPPDPDARRRQEQVIASLDFLADHLRRVECDLERLHDHALRSPTRPVYGPVADQAELLLQRIQAESQTLQHREATMRDLTKAVEVAAGELTRLLGRLQASADEARTAEGRAKSMRDELAATADRAADVLQALARAADRPAAGSGRDAHAARNVASGTTRLAGTKVPPRHFDPLLNDARASIEGLKSLTQGNDTSSRWSRSSGPNRLLHQTEDLLAIVADQSLPNEQPTADNGFE